MPLFLSVHAEPRDDRLDDEVDLKEEDDGEDEEDGGRYDPTDVPHILFYLFEMSLDGLVERLHERERDVDHAEEDKGAQRVIAGGASERRSAIRFREEDKERDLGRDEEERFHDDESREHGDERDRDREDAAHHDPRGAKERDARDVRDGEYHRRGNRGNDDGDGGLLHY